MSQVGDTAPDFTLPKAGGSTYNDIEEFTLSAQLEDGPIVLAFYPAAFTSGCTEEMCSFRDSMDTFTELDAQVYGVSVDLPFTQNIFIEQENLNFPHLSDWNHDVIHQYGVVLDDLYGMLETANRSIFVVDTDGVITHKWVSGGESVDFDDLVVDIGEHIAELH